MFGLALAAYFTWDEDAIVESILREPSACTQGLQYDMEGKSKEVCKELLCSLS